MQPDRTSELQSLLAKRLLVLDGAIAGVLAAQTSFFNYISAGKGRAS